MIVFWVIAGTMTIIVMLMLVIPVLRATRQSSEHQNRTDLNVQLNRNRLHELEHDYKQQRIELSQYQAMKDELELALARDLELASENPYKQSTSNQGKWVTWVMMLGIPVLAVTLYLHYGDQRVFDKTVMAQANARQTAPGARPTVASIEAMVDKLATRLKQSPDDPKGWMMLGRSYMVMGRYQEASDAYAQLHKLVGDEVNVLLQYAQAKVMSNNGQWDDSAIAMLDKALKLEPENSVALSLSGLLAARQGKQETAVNLWKKAQKQLQPDSEQYLELDNMIASISGNQPTSQKTASGQPAGTKNIEKPVAGTGQSIKVRVTITPELLAQAKPDQTTFIYAQALNGPPMPIAVVRKKVSELPAVVTLDDSMAMMPTRKLSSFEQVRIAARISQSGSAMPTAGDLQGKVEPVNTSTNQPVSVVIDQIL